MPVGSFHPDPFAQPLELGEQLERELGIAPSSLVDTELAGRFLGTERVNLGAMISEHLGIGLAKAHSAADWSRRPLPTSWLDYAAYDVLFLHDLVGVVLLASATLAIMLPFLQAGAGTWIWVLLGLGILLLVAWLATVTPLL